jgi:23S rRNA pseudouridine2605 synthase
MKPEAPRKKTVAPSSSQPKLHKALAQTGLGSRLDMERAIEEGRVTVSGEPAHIGQRLQPGDKVRLDGKPVRVTAAPPPVRVLAYHKPVGEVVTHDDPQNRPTVFGRLPRLRTGKWLAVGRLDLNTEGLLLITNSGDLANRLMHPSFGLEREYAVRVLGALTDDEKQRLLGGVTIDGGAPARFNTLEDETGPSGKSDGGESGVNRWYRATIAEGRNREVRRMIEAAGHAVSRLIRIRYGVFALPKGLKRGAWIELDARAIRALGDAVGAPEDLLRRRPPAADADKPARRGRGDRSKSSGPRPDMSNPKRAR